MKRRSGGERMMMMFDGRIVGDCAPETPEAEIGLMMAGAGRENAA